CAWGGSDERQRDLTRLRPLEPRRLIKARVPSPRHHRERRACFRLIRGDGTATGRPIQLAPPLVDGDGLQYRRREITVSQLCLPRPLQAPRLRQCTEPVVFSPCA